MAFKMGLENLSVYRGVLNWWLRNPVVDRTQDTIRKNCRQSLYTLFTCHFTHALFPYHSCGLNGCFLSHICVPGVIMMIPHREVQTQHIYTLPVLKTRCLGSKCWHSQVLGKSVRLGCVLACLHRSCCGW